MGLSSSESEQDQKHKKKKEKKSKKSKKEKKQKKDKKRRRRRRSRSSSESSESGSDEWIEAVPAQMQPKLDSESAKLERDDWMNSMLIPTYSKEPKKEEKKSAVSDLYDPKTSVRELNPHWKNGGTGLPSFRKPANEDDDRVNEAYGAARQFKDRSSTQSISANRGAWKKPIIEDQGTRKTEMSEREERSELMNKTAHSDQQSEPLLTDEQLNALGAKIMKSELLGNNVLAAELKEKLEKAKALRSAMQLKKTSDSGRESASKRKSSVEESVTYTVGKSYDETHHRNMNKQKRYQQNLPTGPALADKFRSERHENDGMDAQFFKVSAKMVEGKRLENIFDHQKASSSGDGTSAAEERTVREMNRMSKAQADCERCINSSRFCQDQIIATGKSVYLSIPTWKALQPKHCFIVPISHYPSLTQVDEDVHQEIVDVCKALVQMFRKHQMEVIFFETVRYLNRNPHTYIQCVPANNYEMAAFYFKKAILESETEWAMNKKLHNVDGFNVKRTVPKNLPYFWVNFNMENGFAHVIEDQESFPVTFATETIAGILGLDTRDWRKPRKEMNPVQKVEEFKHWWRTFDAVLRKE